MRKRCFNSKLRLKQELQAPGTSKQCEIQISHGGRNVNSTSNKFTPEMIQTLIKAVNLLPAGTPKRLVTHSSILNDFITFIHSFVGNPPQYQVRLLVHGNFR
ncbi:hypothetical protein FGIG_08078 [Fasciola gigantica]|uniref:Uncharacterized protein n=1 Tax=Fasciola gigantica TaxID=46835 RepID=A0A504YZ71_FASGI|nr:hypothetical protein FGIG_08078 [Fasciola gigantica]